MTGSAPAIRDAGAAVARATILGLPLLYAASVIVGAVVHEPWRDEVVPLSIARAAASPAALLAALRSEGHPILWYALLQGAFAVVGATWVLKAASVGSAIAAVFLLARSALPWWMRWLVGFSYFPLYQYGVVSRGYSLEMLGLFATCALYPRRHRHPAALALLLAALANTEAFGFVMAAAVGVMLAVEAGLGVSEWRAGSARARAVAVGLYLAGLALAAFVAFPAADHPLAGFAESGSLLTAFAAALARPVGHVGHFAILPWPSVWIWAYFVYLAARPSVLAFAVTAFVGIETFFNFVYGPGAPWHVGNLVLVLIAVMWLDASASPPALACPAALVRARRWLGRVLAAAAVALFADHAVMAFQALRLDVRHDYSANRALGELLRSDPALAGAVVMGEPDPPLWSLPYYAENRIYLAREQTYRSWGTFGAGRARSYDLASLLATARRVRGECACPVVVTLGWRLDATGTFANAPRTYAEEHFVIADPARTEFQAATRLLARLGPTITDENYDVYVLR